MFHSRIKKNKKKSCKPCNLNKGIIRFATRFQKRNGILKYARVAQLVEHDLAKVGVAGSNPVSRSKEDLGFIAGILFLSPLAMREMLEWWNW